MEQNPADSKRLKWQCRRGMRELDLLLQDFLDNQYEDLSHRDKQSFRTLLTYSDQVLFDYLMGKMIPRDGDIANVIERVRNSFTP